jgi:hypothetical protein
MTGPDAAADGAEKEPQRRAEVAHILGVRVGHGANCSSIGSVIDTLFATATVGAAIFAAVVASLASEEVTAVAPPGKNTDHDAEPAPEKTP